MGLLKNPFWLRDTRVWRRPGRSPWRGALVFIIAMAVLADLVMTGNGTRADVDRHLGLAVMVYTLWGALAGLFRGINACSADSQERRLEVLASAPVGAGTIGVGLALSAGAPTLLELVLGAPFLILIDPRGFAVAAFTIPFSLFLTLVGMRSWARLMVTRIVPSPTLGVRMRPLLGILGPVLGVLVLPSFFPPLAAVSPVALFTQLLGDVREPLPPFFVYCVPGLVYVVLSGVWLLLVVSTWQELLDPSQREGLSEIELSPRPEPKYAFEGYAKPRSLRTPFLADAYNRYMRSMRTMDGRGLVRRILLYAVVGVTAYTYPETTEIWAVAFFFGAGLISAILGLSRLVQPSRLDVLHCTPTYGPSMLFDEISASVGPWFGPAVLYGGCALIEIMQGDYTVRSVALCFAVLAAPVAGALVGAAAEHRVGIAIPRLAPGVWMVLLAYLVCVAVLGWMDFGSPVNDALCTLGLKHADSGYLGPTFLERKVGMSHEKAIQIVGESDGSRLIGSSGGLMVHNACLPGMLAYAIAGSLLILFLACKTARPPT